jgi:ribonuclease E
MTKRMLIDSTHPEETRVVVVDGNRLEDFDFESASKQQLKGNIYLARITRVEPSLQAAFVEYGGNRHGFLAFSEIHPDYYRIPIEDREALLAEERARNSDDDDDDVSDDDGADHDASADADGADQDEDGHDGDDQDGDDDSGDGNEAPRRGRRARPETVGGADVVDEGPRKRKAPNRRYKIQEVVARRQIMLVQVVKEERGNKGAALTTYLSLAGRYCVLMPNTARGGGVSRKITSIGDRKRLKQVVEGLDVPDGMAVIVRTAGSERTKAEIKRDYEYLLRLWDDIRETTLSSAAPCLIHEEGNLIKRSIRDLYTRDLDEVLVEGEEGYKIAKSFMRTLIPSHAKRVQPYRDPHVPLLHRFQVESQLDAIHSPQIELKSGGYIVLNQTEALVAIDVNSGRSTSERNIEETALKTNLEASTEIARQLRLRDLAGLIVIDFIDMDESRNQHAVERRMKDAMKSDRARIQIGRISHFGLMELSRQRLRPSLFETSTMVCPHCKGNGFIRSIESTALHILRAIEEEGMRNRSAEITVKVASAVALYILNQKRERLAEIEARYGFTVFLEGDESLIPPDNKLERVRQKTAEERQAFQDGLDNAEPLPVIEEEDDIEDEDEDEAEVEETEGKSRGGRSEARSDDEDDGQGGRRRRRRRGGRRRGGSGDRDQDEARSDSQGTDDRSDDEDGDEGSDGEASASDRSNTADSDEDEDGQPRKRRRRGRRGGRRRSRRRDDEQTNESDDNQSDDNQSDDDADESDEASDTGGSSETGQAGNKRADIAAETVTQDVEASELAPEETPEELPVETPAPVVEAEAEAEPEPEKPKRPRRRTKKAIEAEKKAAEEAEAEAAAKAEAEASEKADEAITAEAGSDETVADEGVETGVDSQPDEPAEETNPAIQVQKVEGPAEKPRKGWWRR